MINCVIVRRVFLNSIKEEVYTHYISETINGSQRLDESSLKGERILQGIVNGQLVDILVANDNISDSPSFVLINSR